MKHTPQSIAALSDTQARDLLNALANDYYKTDRWKTAHARETGITKPAVLTWFRVSRPPTVHILYLQAASEAQAMSGAVKAVAQFLPHTPA